MSADMTLCLSRNPGASVLKPWSERLDRSRYVESDADEQLLLYIPFTGLVKLRSFCCIAEGGGAAPRVVKAFTNQEDLDFTNVESKRPVQEWSLPSDGDPRGQLWHPMNAAKFTAVSSLTLFVESNHGASSTRIYYIGTSQTQIRHTHKHHEHTRACTHTHIHERA